jgi:ABC-2 type transport system permease protein
MTRTVWVLRACLRRDYRVERSYRLAFALNAIGDLAALTLFFYISKFIGRSSLHGAGLERGYFPFVVVGLGMSRILASVFHAIPSRIRQDQLTGALEAVFSTPVRPAVAALGYGLYDLVRAVIETTVFFVIAIAVFGLALDTTGPHLLAATLGFVFILVISATLGVGAAGLVIVFKRVQGAIGIVTTAIDVFGTVYFPASTLPGALRVLAEANPVSWALALIRPLTTGAPVPWNRLALLVPTCTGMVALSLACVTYGAQEAKRRGTLGQY